MFTWRITSTYNQTLQQYLCKTKKNEARKWCEMIFESYADPIYATFIIYGIINF